MNGALLMNQKKITLAKRFIALCLTFVLSVSTIQTLGADVYTGETLYPAQEYQAYEASNDNQYNNYITQPEDYTNDEANYITQPEDYPCDETNYTTQPEDYPDAEVDDYESLPYPLPASYVTVTFEAGYCDLAFPIGQFTDASFAIVVPVSIGESLQPYQIEEPTPIDSYWVFAGWDKYGAHNTSSEAYYTTTELLMLTFDTDAMFVAQWMQYIYEDEEYTYIDDNFDDDYRGAGERGYVVTTPGFVVPERTTADFRRAWNDSGPMPPGNLNQGHWWGASMGPFPDGRGMTSLTTPLPVHSFRTIAPGEMTPALSPPGNASLGNISTLGMTLSISRVIDGRLSSSTSAVSWCSQDAPGTRRMAPLFAPINADGHVNTVWALYAGRSTMSQFPNNNETGFLAVEQPVSLMNIELVEGSLDFGRFNPGYTLADLTPALLRATNIGPYPSYMAFHHTGGQEFDVTWIGSNARVEVGGHRYFTIVPSLGRPVGIRTGDVQVRGESNQRTRRTVGVLEPRQFPVTFTVAHDHEMTVTPATHDFGVVAVGATMPAAQTFTLRNIGTGMIFPTNIVVPDGWAIVPAGFWTNSIAVNATRTFTVRPTAALPPGQHTVTIEITTTAASNLRETIEVSVYIAAPSITVTPQHHDFGTAIIGSMPNAMPTQTFTVRNTGRIPVNLTDITLQTGWTIGQSANWTSNLAANATRTFTISPNLFLPLGSHTLTLEIATTQGAATTIEVEVYIEPPPTGHLTIDNFGNHDVVSDQSPETNLNQLVGSDLIWRSGSVPNQEFLGWVTGATAASLSLGGSMTGVTLATLPDTMPNEDVTFVAVWGFDGIIGGQYRVLTINNLPNIELVENSQTSGGNSAVDAEITLASGTPVDSTSWEFLGWIRGSLLPSIGDNLAQWADDNNVTVRGAGWYFNMPAYATTYTAIWGNHGIVGGDVYQIAFHIYTGNQRLIDRFGAYGTPNADGILVINVPVTPGTPHHEWPNQNLLNVALSVGLVHGVGGTPGHAFWGWFRGETLDNSGRRGPTASAQIPNPTNPGLRRPLLSDRCEWISDGIDGGLQSRIFDLLQNPSITQAQIDNLFGSTGTLDLFAIWSLWGDVNDDDIVNFTDLGILQAYLLFRYVDPNIIDLNRRAGDVFNNVSIDWTDFNLLQSYLLTRDANPGQVILGILPPELQPLSFVPFNARAAFEPMSIAAFADVDVAPLSGSSITWQSPDVVVPAGQTYVDIYFTLDRPAGVARPMGIAGTSIQLLYPQGALNPSNPWDQSFTFAEPIANLCECCFSTFDFNGQIGMQPPFITGGNVVFGGGVTQLGDYAGEVVIRARLMIPVGSPLNNPEIGYMDITMRRGGFSSGTEIFPTEYSTVRITREGLIALTLDEGGSNEGTKHSEHPGHPSGMEYLEYSESSEESDILPSLVAPSQTEVARALQIDTLEATPQIETSTDIALDTDIVEEQFRASFMVGDDRGNFRPNNSITRAEAAATLVRTMDYFGIVPHAASADTISNFSDINPNAWYAEYIAIAHTHGLLQGSPGGTFNPNQPISREEFAAMLARTGLVSLGSNLNASDASHVSDWAADYVYTAFASGLMQGDAIGTFRPREDITRAEAAATFARALNRGYTTEESIAGVSNMRIFPDASDTSAWYYFYVVGATNSHWFINGDGEEIWTRIAN